jgi:LacI family transcriptional regulator
VKKAKVTLTSLAEELGLSICTVSKVLNKSFDGFSYAPATVRRVDALAKKRGYIPNTHARSLRTKRSMTAGLVVPSGIPFFTGTLVESIVGTLRDNGYETLVGHSTTDPDREMHLLENVLGRGVDGLLWIPYSDKLSPEDFGVGGDFPLVILDRPGCSNRFPAVITDNRAASRELAVELASMGVREVAVLTSDCGDRSIGEREAGVAQVFKSRVKRHVSSNEIGAAKLVAAKLLPRLEGRSLLCLTQPLAMGALQAMRDLALRPGLEVGFACFDSLPLCEIWHPSLCRVEQDIEALAREGVRLLLDKIRDPKAPQPLEIRIAGRLVRGDSALPSCSKS